MPTLFLSPSSSLEGLGSCTPAFLWPATPTPTAGRCYVTPQLVDVPEQGSSYVLLEGKGEHRKALTRSDSLLGDELNQPVRVKNTFIDGFLDEEDSEDGPCMVACKTWHTGFMRQAPEPLTDCWDLPPLRPRQLSAASTEGSTSFDSLSSATPPPSEGPSTAPPSPAEPLVLPPPEPVSPVAAAMRRPQVSAGAHLHGTGQCRPCGWFWKPEGCAHGAECCHCHLCPEGELKARKKAKLAALRARNPAGNA